MKRNRRNSYSARADNSTCVHCHQPLAGRPAFAYTASGYGAHARCMSYDPASQVNMDRRLVSYQAPRHVYREVARAA